MTPEQLFIRVVDTGSFKAAAEEIGADPSAVSRRIAGLEARLGAQLLRRSTTGSVPTEAGDRYYSGMRRLLDEQGALESEIGTLVDTPRGRLRVAAPVDFGARFVTPVLAGLLRDEAALAVEQLFGSEFVDLDEAGIDVAIRVGRLPDSSLIARRLGAVPRVIVAAKHYVESYGAPTDPDDLADHDFIFYGPGQRRLGFALSRDGDERTISVSGRASANSVTAIRALVMGGVGLHLGPVWAFERELADGSAVAILRDWTTPAFPVHALYTQSAFVPAKTRMFIDRMVESIAAEPSLE